LCPRITQLGETFAIVNTFAIRANVQGSQSASTSKKQIALSLEHWKLMSATLLYLSLFFKRHRAEYYRLFGEVRRTGDWEAWMGFFLKSVETTADEAVIAAREVFALVSSPVGSGVPSIAMHSHYGLIAADAYQGNCCVSGARNWGPGTIHGQIGTIAIAAGDVLRECSFPELL
jgi:hypothetical protein